MSQFPNPDTQFKKGQSGNAGGKTSEHRKAEVKAAEMAALITVDLMQALSSAVSSCEDDADKLALLKSDTINFLKQAQDRAFGTAKASVDVSSEDGTMTPPTTIQLVAVDAPSDDT